FCTECGAPLTGVSASSTQSSTAFVDPRIDIVRGYIQKNRSGSGVSWYEEALEVIEEIQQDDTQLALSLYLEVKDAALGTGHLSDAREAASRATRIMRER